MNLQERTLELLKALVSRPSVTPDDAGCQQLIGAALADCGFDNEPLRYGEVDNLWAVRGSKEGPLLVFAGHTDVVPPGDLSAWQSDPFRPEERDGLLYGRGCTDMKSGLSAMLAATEAFVAENPSHRGRIGYLITSDEEGPSIDGTRRVMQTLTERGEQIDYAIVGEASSEHSLGDRVMIGRRGSLTGLLQIQGKQGHIAYPHTADNPIHRLAPVLAELVSAEWDQGNAHFPPTSFQCPNLNSGVGADNVIPDTATLQFNFRFSPASSADSLKADVQAILDRHGLDYSLDWRLSGEPFLTPEGDLTEVVSDVIETQIGSRPVLDTGGGTSDARFIAPTGAQVVELGPVGQSAHKIDEHVRIEDLGHLAELYLGVMRRLL